MKKRKLLAILSIASVVSITGCKNDDYVEKVGICPIVVSTVPTDKAIDVPLNQIITATFNEKMNPETITQTSYTLQQGTTAIAGTVSYSGTTASFVPASLLSPFVLYTGRVKTAAKDLMGNALQTDYIWSFTTIPQIILTANPIVGGTTSGAGTFAQSSATTVIATPSVGYAFTNWTENGTIVSTSSTYPFTMAGNKTLVANFSLQFSVALFSNPVLGGTTVGSGTYNSGASITATASPNSEYTFTNWTDNGIIASTNPIYNFILSASRTLVANFAINTYTLNVTALNGTVVKNPSQTTYNSGTTVVLTATPISGYTFTSWSGDATGTTSPLTVTMNASKNITANFTQNTYTLNVTAINGTVVKNPSQTTYNSGTTVELTATPNAGYTFTSWSGDATGTTSPLTVTMNASKNITANFTQNVYTLNVNAINGTVVKNPSQTTYNSGTTVVLTATPISGYTFTSWSGDATGTTSPLTVTMNASKNITANFTQNAYTLNVTAINGTVLKNPSQTTYNSGTTVELTATPNAGYTFTSWSGDATGTTSPLIVTMNASKNITANFTQNAYALNVTALNGTVVKNPSQTTYNSGTTVELTATPNAGYTFTSWSGDATGTTSPLTVTMNANKNITANFTLIPVNTYTLNVTALNGTVVKNPNLVSYSSGANVSLTAAPNSGYTFSSWSGDATGSTNPLTLTMNANKNITANFSSTLPNVPSVDLKTVGRFGIISGVGVSNNAGFSVINNQDVGISPGARSSITGFPPAIVVGGALYAADDGGAVAAMLTQAKLDLTAAYLFAEGASSPAPATVSGDLGGLTLAPGIYKSTSTLLIQSGNLTLDAQGDPNAVWIFQIASGFTTVGGAGGSVILSGGAQAANIFWQTGSSAVIGDYTSFFGTILALQSITMNSHATAVGRMLARNGAVVLTHTNTIDKP